MKLDCICGCEEIRREFDDGRKTEGGRGESDKVSFPLGGREKRTTSGNARSSAQSSLATINFPELCTAGSIAELEREF